MAASLLRAALLLALTALSLSAEPPKPELATTFLASLTGKMTGPGSQGAWAQAVSETVAFWPPRNRSRTDITFTPISHAPPAFDLTQYARYDLGKVFDVEDSTGKTVCHEQPSPETMPMPWCDFLDEATYGGQETFEGTLVDLWITEIGSEYRILAVNANDIEKPVYMSTSKGVGEEAETTFLAVRKFIPWPSFDSSYFEVPATCNEVSTLVGQQSRLQVTRSGLRIDSFTSE
eukprot:m.223883 g.223883  ORF g.223883 m.223883 type:complete len:233 (-) comp10998_c0_seq1:318-1016(-)